LHAYLTLRSERGSAIRIDGINERLRAGRCVVIDANVTTELVTTGPALMAVLEFWHPSLGTDEIKLLEGLSRVNEAHRATGGFRGGTHG
jgi:hypothetical protein